ncbi:hypothetical protein BpHYR1_052634 [Brachionus plicatilis]|uniref:Uncharacterized protein n=1 Tax=Brachionus plicatilis TaxID=10195 RepID=A0A3M7Q391_BRAPC|nr:hypothetical protein BpHYR1_052634 [Brachionus plicatilis]
MKEARTPVKKDYVFEGYGYLCTESRITKCEDQEQSCENDICNLINETEEKHKYLNESTSKSIMI